MPRQRRRPANRVETLATRDPGSISVDVIPGDAEEQRAGADLARAVGDVDDRDITGPAVGAMRAGRGVDEPGQRHIAEERISALGFQKVEP